MHSGGCRGTAALRRDCLFFSVVDLEHRIELRQLEQLHDALGRIDENQLSILGCELAEVAHQLADAGGVDVIDLREVDDHVRIFILQDVFERGGEELCAFTELDQPLYVENREVLGVLLLDNHFAQPDGSKSEAMDCSYSNDAIHAAEPE